MYICIYAYMSIYMCIYMYELSITSVQGSQGRQNSSVIVRKDLLMRPAFRNLFCIFHRSFTFLKGGVIRSTDMCVSLCVYMYTEIHPLVHARIYSCVRTHAHTHGHAYTYAHIYIRTRRHT